MENFICNNFIYGLLGGVLAEYIGIYKIRKNDVASWPHYYKKFAYWGNAIIMIFLGGWLAHVQLTNGLDPKLALQVGATAPLIFERFFSKEADISM